MLVCSIFDFYIFSPVRIFILFLFFSAMTDSINPPLSYEASATTTHPHIATTLPTEVIACLKNSRFVCFLMGQWTILTGASANL